ncbi:MAG: hypothetical protein OHK0022_00820 [Roseiflexaceae bacterium]
MKRFMVILMAVLALVLAGGATSASAAPGGRGPGGRGAGGPGGEVTAVSASSITVNSPRGATTITTTASTTFQVNGAAGSLSDVKVGMFVRAEGSAGTNSSFTATRVIASTEKPTQTGPRRPGRGIGGDATAIDGSTITINTPNGALKIVTSASTTFQVNGAAGSLSDIRVGMFVCAEGATASDGTITATRVIASNEKPARPQQ